jgi:transcriptional regulator with XRE-family HTH domain
VATKITAPLRDKGGGRDRRRVYTVDGYVGTRLRERRIMSGLTQQQMAELIGVTYQQAHKYERGINSIPAGCLYHIAQAFGVDVNYFFEGLNDSEDFKPTSRQRPPSGRARDPIGTPHRGLRESGEPADSMQPATDDVLEPEQRALASAADDLLASSRRAAEVARRMADEAADDGREIRALIREIRAAQTRIDGRVE